MGWFLFPYFILCFFQLLLFHFPSYSASLAPMCNHVESSALLQFKNSFTLNTSADCYQSFYPKIASWKNGTNCCLWDGVTCETKTGDVIGLDLSCSGLQGKLHPNSTLFQLTHLQTLNLAFNSFFESPIFPGFGDLVNLTHLDLSHSGFAGVIPSKISHLSKLVSLDLSDKYYYPLRKLLRLDPSTWKKLILNATNFRELFLWGVDMSSVKPSSLSLLMNLSSSLVFLNLGATGLHGNLANNILCLPNLQFLDFSFNENLTGQLPKSNWSTHLRSLYLSYSAFSGNFPDSIGHLKSLNDLGLSNLNIDGPIPVSLWKLTKLTALQLLSCNISGEIPSSLSNLQNLNFLDLSHNNLGGQLPSSLFDLTQLSRLWLSYNKFVGRISDKFNRLTNLEVLDLSNNLLSGFVDFNQFSKLQHLESLVLSYNNFLSISFDSNSDNTILYLSSLDLSHNKIHRAISKWWNKHLTLSWKNSDSIDLSFNMLEGDIPIPPFGTVFFSVSNNRLTGDIPSAICNASSLQTLDLSHNNLTGLIPQCFGRIVSWKNSHIDLSFNMLQGDVLIPPFGTTFFSVSNNKLTGDISSAICNASALQILNLSHNNLTGLIPQCLGTFPSLIVLDLQMNNLHGTIPRSFLEKNALDTLKLNDNWLEGPLPQSLAHCKQLKVLDLGYNNIQDTFPNWLEPLQELQVLILRANKFHGVITPLNAKQAFHKLRIFDVSNNSFCGPLPTAYIKEFKGMMNGNVRPTGLQYMEIQSLQYNNSVVLTMKGNVVELERILTTFATIDLSNNKFDVEIPEVIGELNSLTGLNLSHNTITGNIPPSLGDMKSLEWMDVSSNKLTGHVPLALTELNFLSFLNLSLNQLEGIIATGKQFNTFNINSYEGNPGLCGWPLSKLCGNDEKQLTHSKTVHHDRILEFGWKPVAVGYACGVVAGMLLGYIVFSTGKPRWLVRLVGDVPNTR